ncbi:MAG: sigma-70 family RNA polymerase sigma factor [Planctomycetota bacterium]
MAQPMPDDPAGRATGPDEGPADGLPADVLQRAAAGDALAWRAVVDAYTGRVYGLLLSRCRDRDLAEELTQDTFVKVVSVLIAPDGARYHEQGRFEPWLFRIAMNRLRDEMRRRARRGAVQGSTEFDAAAHHAVAESTPDPSAAVELSEDARRLRAAVAQLPDADRELLHLRHTAGLGFSEIAETLGQPLGTVLARGHRAIKKLRKLMETENTSPASAG